MNLYSCNNVLIPLRNAPSHKSEMVSQLLFGEKFYIIDRSGHWMKVRVNWDNCTGWIDSDHFNLSGFESNKSSGVITWPVTARKHDDSIIVILPGSEIDSLADDKRSFTLCGEKYISAEEIRINCDQESIPETASRFLNAPYIWGGRAITGLDCSGLTQVVYKLHNIRLPRDSYEQAERGFTVDFISDAEPGDLLFFDDDKGKINHVGIYSGNNRIIHCSGKVRIDKIDHQGIYRSDLARYSHKLRVIKRIQKKNK